MVTELLPFALRPRFVYGSEMLLESVCKDLGGVHGVKDLPLVSVSDLNLQFSDPGTNPEPYTSFLPSLLCLR